MYNDEYTMEINPEQAFEEFLRNPQFRQELESGIYVYVENRFVINSPQFIIYEDGKPLLTKHAWKNLNECALQFTKKIVHDSTSLSGDNFAPPKPKTILNFNKEGNKLISQECGEWFESHQQMQQEFYAQYDRKEGICDTVCSSTFDLGGWEMMKRFNEIFKVARHEFLRDTKLPEYYWGRIKNYATQKGQPSKEVLTAFVIGNNMPPKMAYDFFERAGKPLSDALDIDSRCDHVICAYLGRPMEEKVKWLRDNGVEIPSTV